MWILLFFYITLLRASALTSKIVLNTNIAFRDLKIASTCELPYLEATLLLLGDHLQDFIDREHSLYQQYTHHRKYLTLFPEPAYCLNETAFLQRHTRQFNMIENSVLVKKLIYGIKKNPNNMPVVLAEHHEALSACDEKGNNILHYLITDTKYSEYELQETLIDIPFQALNQKNHLDLTPIDYFLDKKELNIGDPLVIALEENELFNLYYGRLLTLYLDITPKDISSARIERFFPLFAMHEIINNCAPPTSEFAKRVLGLITENIYNMYNKIHHHSSIDPHAQPIKFLSGIGGLNYFAIEFYLLHQNWNKAIETLERMRTQADYLKIQPQIPIELPILYYQKIMENNVNLQLSQENSSLTTLLIHTKSLSNGLLHSYPIFENIEDKKIRAFEKSIIEVHINYSLPHLINDYKQAMDNHDILGAFKIYLRGILINPRFLNDQALPLFSTIYENLKTVLKDEQSELLFLRKFLLLFEMKKFTVRTNIILYKLSRDYKDALTNWIYSRDDNPFMSYDKLDQEIAYYIEDSIDKPIEKLEKIAASNLTHNEKIQELLKISYAPNSLQDFMMKTATQLFYTINRYTNYAISLEQMAYIFFSLAFFGAVKVIQLSRRQKKCKHEPAIAAAKKETTKAKLATPTKTNNNPPLKKLSPPKLQQPEIQTKIELPAINPIQKIREQLTRETIHRIANLNIKQWSPNEIDELISDYLNKISSIESMGSQSKIIILKVKDQELIVKEQEKKYHEFLDSLDQKIDTSSEMELNSLMQSLSSLKKELQNTQKEYRRLLVEYNSKINDINTAITEYTKFEIAQSKKELQASYKKITATPAPAAKPKAKKPPKIAPIEPILTPEQVAEQEARRAAQEKERIEIELERKIDAFKKGLIRSDEIQSLLTTTHEALYHIFECGMENNSLDIIFVRVSQSQKLIYKLSQHFFGISDLDIIKSLVMFDALIFVNIILYEALQQLSKTVYHVFFPPTDEMTLRRNVFAHKFMFIDPAKINLLTASQDFHQHVSAHIEELFRQHPIVKTLDPNKFTTPAWMPEIKSHIVNFNDPIHLRTIINLTERYHLYAEIAVLTLDKGFTNPKIQINLLYTAMRSLIIQVHEFLNHLSPNTFNLPDRNLFTEFRNNAVHLVRSLEANDLLAFKELMSHLNKAANKLVSASTKTSVFVGNPATFYQPAAGKFDESLTDPNPSPPPL